MMESNKAFAMHQLARRNVRFGSWTVAPLRRCRGRKTSDNGHETLQAIGGALGVDLDKPLPQIGRGP